MTKCRNCGTEIPDGAEYCEECLSKLNTAKDSESYLDSLLSAVMTEEPERREIVYPKKEASSLVSMPEDTVTEDEFTQEFVSPAEDDVLETEEISEHEEIPEPEIEEDVPPMEDVFGMFFDADADLPDLNNYSIFGDVDEGTVDRMLAEELGESLAWEDDVPEDTLEEEPEGVLEEEPEGVLEEEVEEEVLLSEVGDIEDLFGMLEDERGEEAPEDIEMALADVIKVADLDAVEDTFSGIVEVEEEVPVTESEVFADLFDSTIAEETVGETAEETEESAVEAVEEPIAEFGDFADLFAGGEENFEAAPASTEPEGQTMADFADLFAGFDGEEGGLFQFGAEPEEFDAASEGAEEEMLSPMPDEVPKSGVPREEDLSEKKKKSKKGGGRFAALFHKLFDNVKVDPSKIKKPLTKEEIEAQKKAKQEAKERSKEEQEALLAEKKEQEKQVKLEKQRAIQEAKAEKKAKKLEEAKLLLEEMEQTRINRAGASIVFIFFAMIAVVIIVGTSIFSYSISIRNAEYEFNRDEYTLAYNEIYGLEIKDEDIVLYDRIMTVMYVQKQLNSYYNYYGMNDKPRALDSLLKGLQRYEKYIELAVELEIDSDLDSVRKKILTEISTVFMLSEQEAMEIIQADSQAEYSKKVYDAVEVLEEASIREGN